MDSQSRSASFTKYTPVAVSTFDHSVKREKHPVLRWGWIWEALSVTASFGCMVAVMVILIKMQEQPLSDWAFFISLNATIAIFITAAKSMLLLSVAACISQCKWTHFKASARKLHELDLFEEASRGPLGSLVLLFRVRWRLGVATLGGLATILALGIDAFAQQVVTLYSRDVPSDDGNATFGLSHFYDSGATMQEQSGNAFTPSAPTVDTIMQGAAFRGIYSQDSTIAFNCSSTCQWNETYVSLGFASQCADVSEVTLAAAKANATSLEGQHPFLANVTTPGGIRMSPAYVPTSWQTMVIVNATGIIKHSSKWDYTPEFVRIAVLRSPLAYGAISDTPEYINTLQIFECDIGLTAYRYSHVSANGSQFNQTVDPIALNAGYVAVPDNTAGTLVFNATAERPELKAKAVDIGALAQFFTSSQFIGTIYDGESPPDPPSGIGGALRSVGIAERFTSMAHSMTNQLRAGYNVTAHGQTVSSVVFVRVDWVWLSLPLLVQVAAVLLLVLTMIEVNTRRAQLWKSSTVAVLYHDVAIWQDGERVLRTDVRSLKELKALAKGTKAKIN
ncbi:uncharacterized protein BCR38DRAFT_472446 [Pseudomassariella vexata]|uniref:Uncharacterized protein n=1 Tax=Pseudomassariella vexata TaxID=1141098 RepID=A0A1Y2EBV4_9PEZI|nr:uncharacterized protein BCR38DRAFT_472446 [Pseudomassariella vexata]ORY69038.1 hypothetical protein BCR38DRAFT_472446 [Pseudomassariella vexata]